MQVITLRDYAKNNNISYEAVRKQVVRYADELGDHIIRDGRQQFLDEEAVAFLDSKRQKNPVAIIQQSKDETIDELTQENKNLLVKLATVQDELLEERKKTEALLDQQKEQLALLDAAEAARLDAEARVSEAEQNAAAEINAAHGELADAHERFETELKRKDSDHAREILERDAKIAELESMTLGDYIKKIFRRKK